MQFFSMDNYVSMVASEAFNDADMERAVKVEGTLTGTKATIEVKVEGGEPDGSDDDLIATIDMDVNDKDDMIGRMIELAITMRSRTPKSGMPLPV